MDINQLLRNVAVPTTGMYGTPRTPEQIQEDELRMIGANLPGDLYTPTLTDEQLAAMMSPEAQAAYQAPTVEDIDQLMHQSRARARAADPITQGDPYAIPEFTEADWQTTQPVPSPAIVQKSAQEERAAKLQSKHGAAGFKFEVDSKGQMVITNTPETRAAVTGINLSEVPKSQLYAPLNFATSMQAIRATEDPVQRAQMMGQLQAEAATFKANIWASSLEQANARLGVPELEASLAENEAADRSDPRWLEFRSDSPKTAMVRQQLGQALAHAEAEAQRMLVGNTQLAAMDAQLQAAAKVYDRAEAATNRKEQLAEAAISRKEQFKDQRTFQQELKIQELREQLGPEKLARVAIMFPDQQGRSADQVALFAVGIKDKDAIAVMEAQPEDLLPLTVLAGNSHAARVLAAREAERSGRTQESVMSEINKIKTDMIAPPAAMEKMVRQIYRGQEGVADGILRQLSLASMGGTNADKQAAQELRYQLVTGAIAQQKEARLVNDVNSWGIVNPELTAAIAASKSADGSANAVDVYKAFTSGKTGQEKQVKHEEFFTMLEQAGQARSQDLIAPINPFMLRTRIETELTRSTIWESLITNLQKPVSVSDMSDLSSPMAVRGARLYMDELSNLFGGAR